MSMPSIECGVNPSTGNRDCEREWRKRRHQSDEYNLLNFIVCTKEAALWNVPMQSKRGSAICTPCGFTHAVWSTKCIRLNTINTLENLNADRRRITVLRLCWSTPNSISSIRLVQTFGFYQFDSIRGRHLIEQLLNLFKWIASNGLPFNGYQSTSLQSPVVDSPSNALFRRSKSFYISETAAGVRQEKPVSNTCLVLPNWYGSRERVSDCLLNKLPYICSYLFKLLSVGYDLNQMIW